MFKIAYGAGHDLLEAGKNFEWHLNERVARYFAEAAAQYENVEIMRTDDPTGRTETRLSERCRKANEWGADFGLSIHHNAGANGTSAGGLMAFAYRSAYEKTYAYRDAIYDACIAAGAIRGNRAEPKANAGFYVLRYTAMPTVLMEYGFMDSTIDRDIIDTEDYAKLVAYATMEGIAKVAGLEKKAGDTVPAPAPEETNKIQEDGIWGYATTAALQRKFGIPVDGIISHQYKPCYDKRIDSECIVESNWEFMSTLSNRGSDTIGKLQQIVGVEDDGILGGGTIRALQAYLGVNVDGIMGCNTVKALQKWINK